MWRLFTVALVGAALLGALGACSSGPGTGDMYIPAPPACELLNGDDAAVALGLDGTVPPSTDTTAECVYEASGGQDTVRINVEPETFDPSVVDGVLESTDSMALVSPPLGDAALHYTVGRAGAGLWVWAKGYYVSVLLTVTSHQSAEVDDLLWDATLTALDRL